MTLTPSYTYLHKERAELQHRLKAAAKRERKLQEQLNRIRKLVVGNERLWRLQRIAEWTDAEADMADAKEADDQGGVLYGGDDLRKDALFLHRLAWDIYAMHDAVHGRRASLDKQGPRP